MRPAVGPGPGWWPHGAWTEGESGAACERVGGEGGRVGREGERGKERGGEIDHVKVRWVRTGSKGLRISY